MRFKFPQDLGFVNKMERSISSNKVPNPNKILLVSTTIPAVIKKKNPIKCRTLERRSLPPLRRDISTAAASGDAGLATEAFRI